MNNFLFSKLSSLHAPDYRVAHQSSPWPMAHFAIVAIRETAGNYLVTELP